MANFSLIALNVVVRESLKRYWPVAPQLLTTSNFIGPWYHAALLFSGLGSIVLLFGVLFSQQIREDLVRAATSPLLTQTVVWFSISFISHGRIVFPFDAVRRDDFHNNKPADTKTRVFQALVRSAKIHQRELSSSISRPWLTTTSLLLSCTRQKSKLQGFLSD